jgi:DNA-binding transcriptional MerR regulator/effector-binding domain-containing protein
MFSIGEFARHGRISVRMLRHYDSIGLLRPAYVEESSGYRFYEAAQLSDLNRIVALKDLGFTLEQVRTILAEHVSAAELRGMLRLRKAEIEARIEAETSRLAGVDARLMAIENQGRALADGVVVKRLTPVRVAELTGVAASYQPEDITPVIGPLYEQLWPRLCAAGVTAGQGIAYYEDSGARPGAVTVHAAVQVTSGGGDIADLREVELPEVAAAATIIHRGSMDDVLVTGQALARWIDANRYRSAGYARELMVEWSPDRKRWVTELQQPVRPADGD